MCTGGAHPWVTGWNASGSENSRRPRPPECRAGIRTEQTAHGRAQNRPALIVEPGPRIPGHQREALRDADQQPSDHLSCSTWRFCLPTYSAAAMTAENTSIAVAMIHRLRTSPRIKSLNATPSKTIGSVPMMTYQPSR